MMLDVLNVSTGRNSATVDKFPNRVADRHLRRRVPHALMAKDVRLFVDAVGRTGTAADGRGPCPTCGSGPTRPCPAATSRGSGSSCRGDDSAVAAATARRTGDRAIVLVHGAWLGEWCWSPVLPLLRTSGRPVITVSLTGHGARRHQSGPHITLGDHADDIVSAIESADAVEHHARRPQLRKADRPRKAASRIAERLRSIVYVDAHAPSRGEHRGERRTPARSPTSTASMLPYTGYDPNPDVLGGQEAVEWYLERIMPQSYATLQEPITGALPNVVRRTCSAPPTCRPCSPTTQRPTGPPPTGATSSFPAPHMVMFSHPEALAEIILDA